MLQIKKVTKSYKTGDFSQEALKDVSLSFRKSEFVAILGPSGSGKTTLLNIIGGLDRYDRGDLVINGSSTKLYRDSDWDAYRNNSVGFVFQSYNLIGHISVLGNVEMGLTLSGMPPAKRRELAERALERVGLKEHMKKRPNQLSGGQMQRVAIARALVGDPDIILADEPTGALDSQTSLQIMDIIKEISSDKLVIMVTHNPKIAEKYATRIVELDDGRVVSDTAPIREDELAADTGYRLKKTAMSFFTALSLSFSNIMTKKGRTFLTAFASSIGIIGIALIMSLSNGFDIKIKEFEADTMAEFPIMISRQTVEVNEQTIRSMQDRMRSNMGLGDGGFPQEKEAYPYDRAEEMMTHSNILTDEYSEYIEAIDPALVSSIAYTRAISMNILAKTADGVRPLPSMGMGLAVLPKALGENAGVVENNYDVLAGRFPESKGDVVLVISDKNKIEKSVIEALGLDASGPVAFDDIVGKKLKLAANDDYYKELGGFFTINPDFEAVYNSGGSLELNVCGILRIKEGSTLTVLGEGIACTEELVTYALESASGSKIVKAQAQADYNLLTGEKFEEKDGSLSGRDNLLAYLGGSKAPYMIMIFPLDFDAKDEILSYLDAYNEGREDKDVILYTDLAEMITTMSGSIMDAITIVLVAFSSIALVVSVIMIGIITYISVMERTREIGVLRSLGARKKDITRVFNAETFIIGAFSGALGIGIALLLTIPANAILERLSGLPGVAQMNPLHAAVLLGISLLLTVIGGFIPAKMAARKDPVAALRTE